MVPFSPKNNLMGLNLEAFFDAATLSENKIVFAQTDLGEGCESEMKY